ncbi:MAG: pseudouridine synthase [Desulfohalobium sp.]
MYTCIAEDERFLCVHKAPDVDCHTHQGQPGLIRSVQAQSRVRLFPLHRLDKVTSGLMLFAKDRETARRMGRMFAKGQVSKYYLALSAKRGQKKQGTVIGDMQRSRRGAWRLCRTRRRPAVTRFVSRAWAPGKRAFLLAPATGKTHQLRVALKSIGAPVLGDPLYAPAEQRTDRCYLHALAVFFVLDGERYGFWLPPRHGEYFLDPEAAELLNAWRRPDLLNWPQLPSWARPESSESTDQSLSLQSI